MTNSINFKKLSRNRLWEEVAGALKQRIIAGDYTPGDKLPPEIQLVEMFGVSRTVIREAIRYLELTGFITIKQGATGGSFIAELSSQIIQTNMRDLLLARKISVGNLNEIRIHLEPEIAGLAALRRTKKDIVLLKEHLSHPHQNPKAEEYIKHHAYFHRLVGRACNNPFYSILADSIMDLTVEFAVTLRPTHRVMHDPGDHDVIFQAILDQDQKLAIQTTLEHVIKIDDQMLALEKNYLEIREKNFMEMRKLGAGTD